MNKSIPIRRAEFTKEEWKPKLFSRNTSAHQAAERGGRREREIENHKEVL